jgi:short-subunit dehydrogenase
MDLHLAGLRALVTGSSRGLGYETARTLASEGAQVVINARDPGRLSAAASQIRAETGGWVEALPGDLADPLVPELVPCGEILGGLDLL